MILELLNFLSQSFSIMLQKLYDIRDALFGSAVVALYNHAYRNKPFKNNIIEFFIGVIFAVYVTPALHGYLEKMNENALSFFAGMTGMKITHLILSTDWNLYFNSFLKSKLNLKSSNSDSNLNSSPKDDTDN